MNMLRRKGRCCRRWLLLLCLTATPLPIVVATSDNGGEGGPNLQPSPPRRIEHSPCRSLFAGGRRAVHFAEEINTGDELRAAVRAAGKSASSPSLHQLNVINGTEYLHLGGALDVFGLVLGQLPSTSSDMSLATSISALRKHANESGGAFDGGVIVNFAPVELVSELRSHEELCAQMQALPLWITQTTSSAATGAVCDGKIPPNIMLEKKFGIDSILSRISKESLLLPKDFHRVLQTVNKAYLGKVPSEDTRFVRTVYRRLGDAHKSSFTDLFLASLLQVLDRELTIGSSNGAQLLPDLQDRGETYSDEDFAEVSEIVGGNRHECHLVTLRAGVLVDEGSVAAAKDQLLRHPNALIVAYAKPYDSLSASDLSSLVDRLGRDRVVLQVASKKLMGEVLRAADDDSAASARSPPQTGAPQHKIPVPTMGAASSAKATATAVVAMAATVSALMLLA